MTAIMVAIVNLGVIGIAAYLVLHGHPIFAVFVVLFGLMHTESKQRDGDRLFAIRDSQTSAALTREA